MNDIDLVLKIATLIGDKITAVITPPDSWFPMYISKYDFIYEINRSKSFAGSQLEYWVDGHAKTLLYKKNQYGITKFNIARNSQHFSSLITHVMKRDDNESITPITLMILSRTPELISMMENFGEDVVITISTRK